MLDAAAKKSDVLSTKPRGAIMSELSDMVHRSVQQAKGELRSRIVAPLIMNSIVWGLVALFGLGALIFLYVLADNWLAARLEDPIAAAAIIAGANALLVLLMLLVRSLTGRRRR
jgi:uncharacterized RDD family membrane protein YckC